MEDSIGLQVIERIVILGAHGMGNEGLIIQSKTNSAYIRTVFKMQSVIRS